MGEDFAFGSGGGSSSTTSQAGAALGTTTAALQTGQRTLLPASSSLTRSDLPQVQVKVMGMEKLE